MFLLSYAANKPAHERHSANVIKVEGHEVMSADKSFRLAAVQLGKRKVGWGLESATPNFFTGTFPEQIYLQLSAVVKFQSQRKRGNSLVHVFGSPRRSVIGVGWGAL